MFKGKASGTKRANSEESQAVASATGNSAITQPAVSVLQRVHDNQESQNKEISADVTPSVKQFKASGNDPTIQMKVDPPVFRNRIAIDVAAQALNTARSDGETPKATVGSWIQYIIDKIKPASGPVKETYVSSFDTAKGGFSASRSMPSVPDLVAHAHYQRDPDDPLTGTVKSSQVKWANDENGEAPPGKTKIEPANIPAMFGDDHVKDALNHWNTNPARHELRAKGKEVKASKDWKKGKDESPWGEGGAPEWMG